MNKSLIRICLKWGLIAGIVSIAIDIIMRYVLTEENSIIRNLLGIITLIIIIVCIFKAIKEYKTKRDFNLPFLFLQGFGAGFWTTFCYCCIFTLHLIILSQCIDKNFFDKYKQKQIATISESNLSENDKSAKIKKIEDIDNIILIGSNFIQSFIFPLMATLFITVFMKQSIPSKEEIKNNKKDE